MFNARNEGEGGAYEAELYVVLPPEADYSGISRNNEVRISPRCFAYLPVSGVPQIHTGAFFPEPVPVDMQLRDGESDPLPHLRPGKPNEIRNKRKYLHRDQSLSPLSVT